MVAKAKKTANKPAAEVAPAPVTIAILGMVAIIEACKVNGFAWVGVDEAKALAAQGLIETNAEYAEGRPAGTIAARVTDKGTEMNAVANGAAEVAKPSFAVVLSFELESGIELPKIASRGRTGQSKYPFDKMEKGQSFFIASKKVSDLASTISGANLKFATEQKDEKGAVVTRTNRKNKVVPVLVYNKKFVVRSAVREVVTAEGKTTQTGVRIFRTV